MKNNNKRHMLGKHQKKLLEFARKYKGWHSYAKDSLTRRVLESLIKRDAIEVNEFGQFRSIES